MLKNFSKKGLSYYISPINAPAHLASKMNFLCGKDFIQPASTQVCGVVAAMQAHNWMLPSQQLYFNRFDAMSFSKKWLKTEDNISLNESTYLVVKMLKEKGINAISDLKFDKKELSQISDLHEIVDDGCQLLCGFDEHLIAVHAVFQGGEYYCVSGLPDGVGGYFGPVIVSKEQLFGMENMYVEIDGVKKAFPLGKVHFGSIVRKQ